MTVNGIGIECREATPAERAKTQAEGILRRAWESSGNATVGRALAYVRDPRAYAAYAARKNRKKAPKRYNTWDRWANGNQYGAYNSDED